MARKGGSPKRVSPLAVGQDRRSVALKGALFLLPGLVVLGALVVYPIFFTVFRSFFDRAGDALVGLGNYERMFTSPGTLTAIKNNLIWVVFAPSIATVLGLIFAVLTERIRWATAFKVAIFMPMAISFLAETISDSGVTPFSIGGADGWTLTDWFENVYVRTAGPEMYDQLAAHEIPWTDDSVVTALETLAEVFGRPELIAGGPNGALQTAFVDSVTRVFADPPEAALVYEGDFVAGEIRANTNAVVGVDADFFPFPSIDGSSPAVIGGGDVAVLLSDTEAGRELISYLATSEAAEVWAERGGFTSPNQSVDLNAYPDETSRGIAEALTQAEVFRFDLSDLQPSAFGSTPGQGLFKQFQDFLADPSNIDAVTAEMESSAAAAYGS